jgi:glycosyltransferase involved in cell wall biosynthesis
MDQTSHIFSINFIIPVLNGEKYMAGCLEHIRREMAPGDEIIVVDNGSTDSTMAIVAEYPEVKLLTHPKATIAAVRNYGAKTARGDLLAFIDCDCLVCPGWRQAATEVLSDENIVATGSHLDLPEKPSWVEAAWISARKLVATPVGYIPSGNFVVKSAAFRAVSGFDEAMITDEDTDIGMRLCQKGFGIINAPQVRAVHLANPKTLGQFMKKEKWHSTSILNKVTWRTMDKPMAMTFAFLACVVAALTTMPAVFLGRINPVVPIALVLTIPLITVSYRLYQFGTYRYFFQQIILYLLFYSVRSLTVIDHLLRRNNRMCA